MKNTDTVYRIKGWREKFETAKSRGYTQLSWIACPVSFQSRGFQLLLDTFPGERAAALYGAWQALCKVAAGNPDKALRGTLCGSTGHAYSLRQLERLSGFPADLFRELIAWAVSVDWLEAVESPVEQSGTGPGPGGDSPGTEQGPARDRVGALPDRTETETEQKPPPPPDPGVAADESVPDWDTVAAELRAVGVADVPKCISRATGLEPREVLDLIAEYNAEPGRFRGPGAICWRLDRGVWPAAEQTRAPRGLSDRATLEKRHGLKLDTLSVSGERELCQAAGVRYCPDTGIARVRLDLLRFLESTPVAAVGAGVRA